MESQALEGRREEVADETGVFRAGSDPVERAELREGWVGGRVEGIKGS